MTITTKNPASASSLANGISGASAWTNPTNALSSNNLYASFVDTDGTGLISQYLYLSNFSMSLPTDSVIDGIRASVEKRATGIVQDYFVSLAYPDGANTIILTPGREIGSNWNTSDFTTTYGDTNDPWGKTWTIDEINHTNFGLVIAVETGDENDTAQIDHVQMTVVSHIQNDITSSGGVRGGGTGDVEFIYNHVASGGVELTSTGEYSIDATGGAEVGGSGINFHYLVSTPTGGAEVGGHATEYFDFDTTGGAEVGGHATEYFDFDTTGGAEVGGASDSIKFSISAGSGGCVVGGVSDEEKIITIAGSGGCVVGGDSLTTATYILIAENDGVEAGGNSNVGIYFFPSGGIEVGGESQDQIIDVVVASGGVQVSPNARLVMYWLHNPVEDGGVVVKGSARKEKIRTLQSNKIKNFENAIESTNDFKVNFNRNQLINQDLSPESIDSGVRFYKQPTWKFVNETHESDASIPAIIENRQKGYLPPQNREDAVADASIASA